MNYDPGFTRLIFEQMSGYFFMKDRTSYFLDCNAAFAAFAGETMESLIRNFIILPDDAVEDGG